jgi:hypothetical protein
MSRVQAQTQKVYKANIPNLSNAINKTICSRVHSVPEVYNWRQSTSAGPGIDYK